MSCGWVGGCGGVDEVCVINLFLLICQMIVSEEIPEAITLLGYHGLEIPRFLFSI